MFEFHDAIKVIRKSTDTICPSRYTYKNTVGIDINVPAYFFHQIRGEGFKRECKKIYEKGLKTTTFEEVLDDSASKCNTLIISFDDGWSSVWSMAFPLARRYEIKFTLFIVPQAIENSNECRSTLDDDVNSGTLVARDLGPRGMLTWGEVRKMHKSGLVDVQSHSLHHGVVFFSSEITGFSKPEGPFPLDGWNPLVIRESGKDVAKEYLPNGTILHEWKPALSSPKRFIENSEVRDRCIKVVRENGGPDFFSKEGSYSTLECIAQEAGKGTWESDEERVERFRKDLSRAKRLIEKRLPGAQVRVLAPPWGAMHEDLPAVAQETGHELIVTGYRYDNPLPPSPIPVYPRLYGESIWTHIEGPLRGPIHWWQARQRNLAAKAAGSIP